MTTKDYIKLSLIAAGYVKNISVEVNRYGINVEYNVYGETWDYEEPDGDYIDMCATPESDGVIDIRYESSLLNVLSEICEKQRQDHRFFLSRLSNSVLLDDEMREDIIRGDDEMYKRNVEYTRKMQPVVDYLKSIDPCEKAPNCGGDFDDSDTCNGFWKCTHQYHHNCTLKYSKFIKLNDLLYAAYKKYAFGEEMTEEETNLLKEHKLI